MPRTRKEWKVAEGKSCFVGTVIGAENSDRRAHANSVLRHIIKPVCNRLKMQAPVRADEMSKSGNISNQIMQHILSDDLMVIDLSFHNPNVFYEMAIRHCAKKPYVHLIRTADTIPFDVAPQRTVHFDLNNLDSVEEAKRQLLAFAVAALTPGAEIDTPIGQAITFNQLEAGNAADKAIAGLTSQLASLRTELDHRLTRISTSIALSVPMRPANTLEGKISGLLNQLSSLSPFEAQMLDVRFRTAAPGTISGFEAQEAMLRKFVEDMAVAKVAKGNQALTNFINQPDASTEEEAEPEDDDWDSSNFEGDPSDDEDEEEEDDGPDPPSSRD